MTAPVCPTNLPKGASAAGRWLRLRLGALALWLGLLLLHVSPHAPVGTALAQPVPEPTCRRITLAAVGDLLMHLPIVNSVHDPRTERYDFSPIFAPVAAYLNAADYTIANLETRLAGPGKGYHGYPRFNSPADLARDLRNAGIDLLATANNHSMDMGWEGIAATLDHLDACGLAHVGTYRSSEERAWPLIVEVNGIKLAFLNYTASTNGIPLPAGKPFAVNLLSAEAVIAEATAARRLGADLVIALLHFGNEYQRTPDAAQRALVSELISSGVDLIIGGHPHVVQPIERITVERNGDPCTGVVAYSLGNFLSNQRKRYRDSGVIAYFHIEKTPHGTAVASTRYLPVWVQKRKGRRGSQFRVLPAHPAISPSSDLPLTAGDRRRMSEVWQELTTLLNDPSEGTLAVDLNPPTLSKRRNSATGRLPDEG